MPNEEKKPLSTRDTLELVARQVQTLEMDRKMPKEIKLLAVSVSLLTAIVDSHEAELARLRATVEGLVNGARR